MHCLSALYYLQHLSNGPIGVDITEHEEQMEEMQFLLDKRTKEVERVILCGSCRSVGLIIKLLNSYPFKIFFKIEKWKTILVSGKDWPLFNGAIKNLDHYSPQQFTKIFIQIDQLFKFC